MNEREGGRMRKQPVPTIEPRLLVIKDAAKYLAVHVWFLRSAVWAHRIPSLKLGNRLLFDRRDLDAFVEQQKTA
jgi:excisionase family DNA binding protein